MRNNFQINKIIFCQDVYKVGGLICYLSLKGSRLFFDNILSLAKKSRTILTNKREKFCLKYLWHFELNYRFIITYSI